MKKLAIIVAMDMNDAIGKAGQIPWHIPEDLKRFKELTMGRPVIMGRKTFDSLGKQGAGRLLPGRLNVIVSRDMSSTGVRVRNLLVSAKESNSETGGAVAPSFEAALEGAYEKHEEPFVIGGADIYKLAMPLVTRLEWTQVFTRVEGADTFMPKADILGDYENFDATFSELKEHNGLKYQFCTALRKEVV